MSDMFKKLNLLLKSRLNDVMGENPLRRRPLDSKRLGKDLDREVEYLRKQINDAIAYEEGLQEKVASLMQDAERVDRQADEAVENGDEIQARRLIAQLQRIQQHLTIAQSDLHEHQLVTQDLIQKVNVLDAVVAEAKRQKQQDDSHQSESDDEESGDDTNAISNILRDTREKISNIGENITTLTSKVSSNETEATSSSQDVSDEQELVSDDLEKRRQRLSKPK